MSRVALEKIDTEQRRVIDGETFVAVHDERILSCDRCALLPKHLDKCYSTCSATYRNDDKNVYWRLDDG